MSKEPIGYRTRNGFIPYKEGAFSLTGNGVNKDVGAIQRQGTFVLASLYSLDNLLSGNTTPCSLSIPFEFRPTEDIIVNCSGMTDAGTIISATIKQDAKLVFKCKGIDDKYYDCDTFTLLTLLDMRNIGWKTNEGGL